MSVLADLFTSLGTLLQLAIVFAIIISIVLNFIFIFSPDTIPRIGKTKPTLAPTNNVTENYVANRVPSKTSYYEYTSATMAPKSNQIAMDGMTAGPVRGTAKPWKAAYAQTGYPLSTGIVKDGMTHSPGYYAGNCNPGVGPPQIQEHNLTNVVESNISIEPQ